MFTPIQYMPYGIVELLAMGYKTSAEKIASATSFQHVPCNSSNELQAGGKNAQHALIPDAWRAAVHLIDKRQAGTPLNCVCVRLGMLILCHCRKGRCRVCRTPSCQIPLGRCLCSL